MTARICLPVDAYCLIEAVARAAWETRHQLHRWPTHERPESAAVFERALDEARRAKQRILEQTARDAALEC